jgi:hypothetical protein
LRAVCRLKSPTLPSFTQLLHDYPHPHREYFFVRSFQDDKHLLKKYSFCTLFKRLTLSV